MKLGQREFLRKVAEQSGITLAAMTAIYQSATEIAKEEIAQGNTVQVLRGLFIYGDRHEPRVKYVPSVDNQVDLPERTVPRARFSPKFKEEVMKRSQEYIW